MEDRVKKKTNETRSAVLDELDGSLRTVGRKNGTVTDLTFDAKAGSALSRYGITSSKREENHGVITVTGITARSLHEAIEARGRTH